MQNRLHLNSSDAALIELALQCQSVNEFCEKLGLATNGGSKTRARVRLMSLNRAFGWLNPPDIPANNKGRSDIVYAPYKDKDGHLIKAYEARPINQQTMREDFLGVFTSFSKAQQAISLAYPQRANKRTPEELIADRIRINSIKESSRKGEPLPRVKKTFLFNDPEILRKVIEKSTSLSHALSFYTQSTTGGNPKTLSKRIAELGISTAHFRRRAIKVFLNSDEILQLNSGASNKIVRTAILNESLIPYQCSVIECGQLPVHCGKPLTLQLEHINGNRNDHRLSNLTFLCPSCHSQTETYGGKNTRRHSQNPTVQEIELFSEQLTEQLTKRTGRHKFESIALKFGKQYFETALLKRSSLTVLQRDLQCSAKSVKRAFEYWELNYLPLQVNSNPCGELLNDELNQRFKNGESFTSIAKDYNCSANAIKKRARAVGADLSLLLPKFKRPASIK